MAQAVLIYEGKGAEFARHAAKWQEQWETAEAKYRKGEVRTTVEMPLGLDWIKYTILVGKACRTAGKGGTLLMLVGHGGDVTTLMQRKDRVLSAEQELAVGMFDLAPCKKGPTGRKCDFRQEESDVFYDYAPPSTVARSWSPMESDFQSYDKASYAQKQAIKAKFMDYIKYRLFGHCVQANGLRQVVLLNCNVGNATEFMQKVANDWQVPVVAFKRRLETREEPKSTFVRMYAFGEAHDTGSNQHEARYNYPEMHARTFKPKGPPAVPMSVIFGWMNPSQPTTSATSAKGGLNAPSRKPVGAGAR